MTPEEREEILSALSPKERLFVEAYFACDYNGSEAIRQAGYDTKYPNKMASEMLRKPKIKAAVDVLKEERLEEVTVSAEYVLRKLVRTVEKAEKQNNHNATLRGLELLAKHLGMFIERTEITGKDGEAIQLEKIQNDADAFASAIASLTKRGREGGVARETEH